MSVLERSLHYTIIESTCRVRNNFYLQCKRRRRRLSARSVILLAPLYPHSRPSYRRVPLSAGLSLHRRHPPIAALRAPCCSPTSFSSPLPSPPFCIPPCHTAPDPPAPPPVHLLPLPCHCADPLVSAVPPPRDPLVPPTCLLMTGAKLSE